MAPRGQIDNQPAVAKKSRKSAKKRHVSGRLILGFNLDLALLSSVVMIIVLLAWLTLREIKDMVRQDMEIALSSVVNSTSEEMHYWILGCMRHVEIWATSPGMRKLVEAQLALPAESETLLASPALAQMRSFYQTHIEGHGFLGFFVISPEHISIASARDSNISTRNLLSERGEFLAKVFSGSSAFSLPMQSDIPLPGVSGQHRENEPAMFVAAPVRNEQDLVIAALTLRVDPSQCFAHISKYGRVGQTGETYAFDSKGRLITRSRFENQLREIGLLREGENSILTVEVRDPGGNLLKGFKPSLPRSQQPLTFMASQAVTGSSAKNLEGYRDYRGVPVVGTWKWNEELGFGVAAEIDLADAYKTYKLIRLIVLSLLILTVLLFFSLLGRLYKSRKEALDQANRATATKNQLQKEMKTRQNVEKILRENEEYIRAVVDSVMDGIITTNNTGEIETFNPTAEKMFGYRELEIVGENLSILVHDNYRERLEKQLGKFSSSGKADIVGTSQEVEGKRENGSTFPMELLISETHLGDYRKLVAITRDITRHKKLEKRLRLLSTQDGLTGIANRRLFDRTIEVEWSRAVRNSLLISLIMIDIDFFKNYNDSLGHQAGDDALKKIAVTMQQNFMRPGDLVARYGGEEFVALLPETSPNGATMLAERLRKEIEALKIPHPDSKIGEFVTISLGVAHLIPRRGSRHDKLVSLADKTLYQAKREGRNRVVSIDLSKETKETAKKGQEN